MIVLGTLPCLEYLDLSHNNIKSLPVKLLDMERWQDSVIELLLPAQVAALDAHYYDAASLPNDDHDSHSVTSTGTHVFQTGSSHPPEVSRLLKNNTDMGRLKAHSAKAKLVNPVENKMNVQMAYKSLNVLILEGNKLGLSLSTTYWQILSKLPKYNF